MSAAQKFLKELNEGYLQRHQAYEELFWTSYMGISAVDTEKNKALEELDRFRSDESLRAQATSLFNDADTNLKTRLKTWIDFFDQYQMSDKVKVIKKQIDELESVIGKKRATRTEGYIDPQTKKFVEASTMKMRTIIQTNPDEATRKACFEAREELALGCLDEYVALVTLRNKYATLQGYDDFYDFNLRKGEKISKSTVFDLFKEIAENTKVNFKKIRDLEKKQPGLRKPWNFSYFLTGDFTKEEDKYYQFDQSILRWGQSFAALGIDFKKGSLVLDLLDRKGKYNNGFCHWPKLVNFHTGNRLPGTANFTCNVVAGQVGSGVVGYNTLFHEGGHAAHFLNTEQIDVCLNHEYAPMTASWSETQSMFIDTMFSSIEWKSRYAKDSHGQSYPFSLYERKEKQLSLLRFMRITSVMFISTFEKEVYELKKPTADKIKKIAKKSYRKFNDMSEDSYLALNTPHIYSWESACSYHGYGLAEIALQQWREYFYEKYGYIVDNQEVGREMQLTWQWGASKSFDEAIKTATGKKLSPKSLIKEITMTAEERISRGQKRIERMESVKPYIKPVKLNAKISLVHGKKEIANNSGSFEEMAQKYAKWIKKMGKN